MPSKLHYNDRLDPHAVTTLRQLYKLYGANRLHRALDALVAEDTAQFNKEHRDRLARDRMIVTTARPGESVSALVRRADRRVKQKWK